MYRTLYCSTHILITHSHKKKTALFFVILDVSPSMITDNVRRVKRLEPSKRRHEATSSLGFSAVLF